MFVAFFFTLGCAEFQSLGLEEILQVPGTNQEARIAAGLREALRVGTQRAVSIRSQPGGFAAVPSLRLRLPNDVQPAAKTLRAIGMGHHVDELESAMNRAAERSAGEAVPVFADAIASMTIADAYEILNGADDAATRYFQDRTSAALRTHFAPVVQSAMAEVGVYQAYSEAMKLYEALPLSQGLGAPDLQGYVLDRTLSGLFSTVAAEEARIREDPAARTTALLRDVFGNGVALAPGSQL
jgi:hypothetical protein